MTIKRQKELSLKKSRLIEQFRKEVVNAQTSRDFLDKRMNMNILLLDGDKNYSKKLAHHLQSAKKDCKIYVCQSEFTAMKILKDSTIDLLMISLELQTFDGFDFGKSVRSLMRKDYPIVYFSKDESKHMEYYFQDILNAHFVHNPFELEEVDEAFRNLITIDYSKVS